jgi:lysophospholipase L1-like esterase
VLQIGGLIGSAAYGRFSAQAFFFWNRPLTNSEWKQMSLWVRNHYSVATLPAPTFNIVVDGNSLALGYFSLNYCCMNAGIIAANGSPGQTGYVNKAESGAATSVLLADAATRVDPLYKSKGKFSIIIFWEGTNDIGNNLTDVQAYTNIKNYCIGRKAAGWNKTIVGTILPRNGSPNPSFEATRISVNSMIRAAKAANESWLDAVADIGGDSNLQTPSDTTYYSDGLHLTDSGHILATPYITAAINAVTA